MPHRSTTRWIDTAAQVLVAATAVVLALTSLAGWLGPSLSGLLSPFPVFSTVLVAFAQRQGGASAAWTVLRGVPWGLYAFLAFFVVLSWTLGPLGTAVAFGLASLVALSVQAATAAALTPQPHAGMAAQ